MASSPPSHTLQSIRYTRGQLQLLDQRRLPLETVYMDIPDSSRGWYAIKEMVVRGAPAIAIAAALSLAVEVFKLESKPASVDEAVQFLYHRLDYLVTSRPTAVNLSDAATKLKEKIDNEALTLSNVESIFNAYIEAAEEMLNTDVASNKAIGAYGAEQILKQLNYKDRVSILTHCNTGSLATAAYGTALGVIRSLHAQGKLDTVYCTETRPYNQGSRLTAYELVYEKIPAVLIADSAAAALQCSGKVDAIVVGADRVAANGDTANKIGTYSLALSAFHHGVPFYVAAPLTSIDTNLTSGDSIVIEERSPKELTHMNGGQGSQIAATGISVWNPAFDVTPAQFITGIITDKGIITKAQGSTIFDIPSFCKHSEQSIVYLESKIERNAGGFSNGLNNNDISDKKEGFYILNERSLRQYIESVPSFTNRLGGKDKDWGVTEVGDGNLNFVYIVVGPKGSLVLKQSVPYVRCIGESWPMNSDRAYYESKTLKKHGSLCPQHVPEVFQFDRVMSTIAMQYLEPPYIVLRKGLIMGVVYPLLADHMSEYMARTLFHTSLLACSTLAHRSAIAEFCGNVEMCRLTEQVIFTDPYMISSINRWTSPHLDDEAKALREDEVLKLEIAELKSKFCEQSQALIHGDLHTGSIMVTVSSTKVIDPEFSFYGPIGFDVGAFLGNLLLAYFSQDGHADDKDDRKAYKRWLLNTIVDTWNNFDKKFRSLWTANWDNAGDAFHVEVYKSASERLLAQNKYMEGLLHDTLGFAAAKMIRRIVGIAHVADFESIENPDIRAKGEKRAISAAKKIMKERRSLSSIDQLLQLISADLYV